MLLVLCVDLDDDLGRKTGIPTPVLGDDDVTEAAVALATADPEDSDVNVLFQGVTVHDELAAQGEAVTVAAVTGVDGSDVQANRAVGAEVDRVLAELSTGEEVSAIVITDGAQDESVLPVIRSRMPIDGMRRVVVRQAQDLESLYYTIKQVLADPETRGTILVPLGILLLIYPLVVLANRFDVAGAAVLGLISGGVGLYSLFRGLGLEASVDRTADALRNLLYAGRVTLITYVVALALIVVGGVQGTETVATVRGVTDGALPLGTAVTAFVHGFVQWLGVAGVTSSLGQITDEYLAGRFRWRYLNAPFYVVAIAVVSYGVTGFVLPSAPSVASLTLADLALVLAGGTLLGVLSTLTFAIAESQLPSGDPT
jgi:putative membrane protein